MSEPKATRPIALIVLAAGQGTRMNSDLPKPLHKLGGMPLIAHALFAGAALEPSRIVVVTGHGADAVEKAVEDLMPFATCVRQDPQLGTGHAVLQAADALGRFRGRRHRPLRRHALVPRRNAGRDAGRARGRMTSSCWASAPPIRAATGG
jgi:hypothetical protein